MFWFTEGLQTLRITQTSLVGTSPRLYQIVSRAYQIVSNLILSDVHPVIGGRDDKAISTYWGIPFSTLSSNVSREKLQASSSSADTPHKTSNTNWTRYVLPFDQHQHQNWFQRLPTSRLGLSRCQGFVSVQFLKDYSFATFQERQHGPSRFRLIFNFDKCILSVEDKQTSSNMWFLTNV